MIIDPTRYYEIKGQVYPLRSQPRVPIVGANQNVIPAITGKQILIMGWSNQAVAALLSVYQFLDGSTGSALTSPRCPPPAASGLFDELPVGDVAYYYLTTGNGLYANITTDQTNFNIFYIALTP